MPFIEDFNLLLKARYSLIYISTTEEDRLEYTIRNCVKLGKDRAIYTWDFIDGFLNNPNNPLLSNVYYDLMEISKPSLYFVS